LAKTLRVKCPLFIFNNQKLLKVIFDKRKLGKDFEQDNSIAQINTERKGGFNGKRKIRKELVFGQV